MTWEIFIGITVIISFVISIGRIIKSNTQAMTSLKDGIATLSTTLEGQKKDINIIDTTVHNHETRITVLEHKGDGCT